MAGTSARTIPARILLVDDNNMGLLARRSVLEELGHEVFTSSSPGDALEQCAKHRFDVVVTDYKMPKMNGVEFIARLRKLHANTSVVLISGFTDTLGLTEANTGADIVLQKSANEVSHLIRAVNRLLRKPLATRKKPASSQVSPKSDKRKSV
jgi:CheY-like chemotaxis protein